MFQAAWDATHARPPSLFGRNFALVGAGNRYGLPPFYQLHVWLWRPNPSGMFNDWNPKRQLPRSGRPGLTYRVSTGRRGGGHIARRRVDASRSGSGPVR